MKPRDIVLVVLSSYGGGIRGKTMVQKVCYFADVVAHLGLPFKAHYYGPYSPTVEQALAELKNLGFVKEETLGFGIAQNEYGGEVRRYDYRLTDDGLAVVEDLKRREPEEFGRIAAIVGRIHSSGNPDYRELSIAAKTFFIAQRQNGPITTKEIEEEARNLGWQLSPEAVRKSVGLLGGLNLVRVK